MCSKGKESAEAKERKAQEHVNDKRTKSGRVVMGAEFGLSWQMPHEWKHVVSKVVSASCQVVITTTVS